MYFKRKIDDFLHQWKVRNEHKPLLLRGARQVGKSTAVRHLAAEFESFVEINFERNPEYKQLFDQNLDVQRIVQQLSAMSGVSIVPGATLVFFDEVQECPEAIMSLRFFHEEMPALHVVAAGSLLEFALDELPTFGVGRIHSMFMYPFSFDEFLLANGEDNLLAVRNAANAQNPLLEPIHNKLVALFRTYILVGGMPEAVAKWVSSHDYLQCQEVQDDIVMGYENDFPKYRKRIKPELLRLTLRSCALQATHKFVTAAVGEGYKSQQVNSALDMLAKAGIIVPVFHSSANDLPLGGEANRSIFKVLLLDTGLMLRLLNMQRSDAQQTSGDIFLLSDTDLVNKGPIAEMLFGLEYLRSLSPHLRHELYYWKRQLRNSLAEIDYVVSTGNVVLPIEVKASCQGGMKSLWSFLSEKKLTEAVRCSLENFGELTNTDKETARERHLSILPLYAVSQLIKTVQKS